MSKFISSTTTSTQISIQSPQTNINTSSKHRATQTTPTSFRSFNPALSKISSVAKKYTTLLQSAASCKKTFSNPPVIAYRRNASLRDLLVPSTLSPENSSGQQPAGIKKCNHPRCLTCSFLREGQTNYSFLQPTKLEKSRTPYLATPKILYT